MIARYSRPHMTAIWSDEYKYDLWLKIELSVCEAWSKLGEIPKKSLSIIKRRAGYDIGQISKIESETKHDVIAFLASCSQKVGREARWIHMGLTSSDLLDTAFASQLVSAGNMLLSELTCLTASFKKTAIKYKMTPIMGRTHGVHAEPTTFGLKVLLWYSEFKRHEARLKSAIEDVRVGKISGAVGTYAHVPPQIESSVLKKLGLKRAPQSSQIIQRDRHAHYFSVLAGCASSIEKVALEIRNLQRTEIFEAAEPFSKSQKGSSAMPHKRNPIMCENLCGLARVVRTNSAAALENVALWHERDISHSSVERLIAPDTTILVDFMLARLTHIITHLDVFPRRMMANIARTKGLYASQDALISLIKSGMTREKAYKIVQKAALTSWEKGVDFKSLISGELKGRLGPNEINKFFDIKRHLVYVDKIFKDVL